MTDPEKPQNFWTTLPGVLTALAGLLTAATGLLVILRTHPPSAPAENPPAATSTTAPGSGLAPPGPLNASPASSTEQKHKGTVVVIDKDGTTSQLFLRGFGNSMTDQAIGLSSGQSVPFEKIRTIDFLAQHDYQRDVSITLVDGHTLQGSMPSGQQFSGNTDIGPFSISAKDLKQIQFQP